MPTGADQGNPMEGISPLPKLADIRTVSESFGISPRQVRRFVANGAIPFVRVGHLIRFDIDELNEWLNARRTGSIRSEDVEVR